MKFRKKPVFVEAVRWWGPEMDVDFVAVKTAIYVPRDDYGGGYGGKCKECGSQYVRHGWIKTLEGWHIVCPGDWIIKGVAGEVYPCKPCIFDQTYESYDEPSEKEDSDVR